LSNWKKANETKLETVHLNYRILQILLFSNFLEISFEVLHTLLRCEDNVKGIAREIA